MSRNKREGYYAGKMKGGIGPDWIKRHRRVNGEHESFALRNWPRHLKASAEMSKELHGSVTGI